MARGSRRRGDQAGAAAVYAEGIAATGDPELHLRRVACLRALGDEAGAEVGLLALIATPDGAGRCPRALAARRGGAGSWRSAGRVGAAVRVLRGLPDPRRGGAGPEAAGAAAAARVRVRARARDGRADRGRGAVPRGRRGGAAGLQAPARGAASRGGAAGGGAARRPVPRVGALRARGPPCASRRAGDGAPAPRRGGARRAGAGVAGPERRGVRGAAGRGARDGPGDALAAVGGGGGAGGADGRGVPARKDRCRGDAAAGVVDAPGAGAGLRAAGGGDRGRGAVASAAAAGGPQARGLRGAVPRDAGAGAVRGAWADLPARGRGVDRRDPVRRRRPAGSARDARGRRESTRATLTSWRAPRRSRTTTRWPGSRPRCCSARRSCTCSNSGTRRSGATREPRELSTTRPRRRGCSRSCCAAIRRMAARGCSGGCSCASRAIARGRGRRSSGRRRCGRSRRCRAWSLPICCAQRATSRRRWSTTRRRWSFRTGRTICSTVSG